ncbi:MAG TPA: rhomboid family intramembrane serine protease [Thermoanaerobaculia bacterium]|jgi:membrane associated rhomboid family serine protease|nr:rhomboid family intramembrane serine protease [Thermoanaerobaculia bacterium]
MFRSRGENLRSVYVLLFLNVAFFLLEHQDPAKFARLFRFDWELVRAGEVWRLVTWQFTQAGTGFMEALSLFVTLLLLYMMGAALEEEWGTRHFMTLFALSTLGSAATAAFLGIPLLATYFVYFTLLFVYAAAFPQQTFYLFGMMPIPVRVLALFSLAVLLYGVFTAGAGNVAALGGAAAAYLYYLTQTVRVQVVVAKKPAAAPAEPVRVKIDTVAMHNAARHVAMKQAVTRGEPAELERLVAQFERDIVAGVNICPPADYKPENVDGYCIRCEGFAECSARHLRLNRHAVPPADAAASSLPLA